MSKNKIKKYPSSRDKKKLETIIKIIILLLLLMLSVLYFILKVVYETGPFTITLEEQLTKKSGLIMYEKLSEKEEKRILKSENLEFLDNISIDWIPADVASSEGGSHNGDNYIAYTFFIENQGIENASYWYATIIDDVIKDVDEAVRVRIYLNDESVIYAKKNKTTGQAEQGTREFHSDKYVELEQRRDLAPGGIDKFTIVMWLEGDDPDCIDSLIGGEIKMHMEITQEKV